MAEPSLAGSCSWSVSVARGSEGVFEARGVLHAPADCPPDLSQISGFRVGAVAVGESGTSYLGGNVEFRHQGLEHVIHAEEFAITNAINHGERSISHLAVSMAPCGCEKLSRLCFP